MVHTLLEKMENWHRPLWEPESLTIKRNDLLQNSGDVNTRLYYVIEGALQILHETEVGTSTIRFAYKGSLFASLDTFITGKPSVYSIQAIRKTVVKVLPKESFMEFINSAPENLRMWNDVLSHTIVSLLERETDILTASPRERYERLLSRSPGVFQEIPNKHIAAYLRMAPETLSRLKKS